jgi:hypothetical protein
MKQPAKKKTPVKRKPRTPAPDANTRAKSMLDQIAERTERRKMLGAKKRS